MPMMSTKNARLSAPRGVNISTGPRCARSDKGVQSVESVGQRSRLELGALLGLLGLTGEGGLEHLAGALGLDDRDAVGVEHDEVARADLAAADRDRHVELARDV